MATTARGPAAGPAGADKQLDQAAMRRWPEAEIAGTNKSSEQTSFDSMGRWQNRAQDWSKGDPSNQSTEVSQNLENTENPFWFLPHVYMF